MIILDEEKRESRNEKARKLVSRWIITGKLTMTSAAQIGSQEGDIVDQTFERDAEGNPILRGSSLAGALRSTLNDGLSGLREAEIRATEISEKQYRSLSEQEIERKRHAEQAHAKAAYLYGDLLVHESPVICFDSVADRRADNPSTTLRDHVRIHPVTGLAEDGKKFDRELTLPGLEFPLRLEVLVPEGADEANLLATLGLSLLAMERGEVPFGARKTRGMGACSASEWRVKRFDLRTPEGWEAYGDTDPIKPITDDHPGEGSIVQALKVAYGEHGGAIATEVERSNKASKVRRLQLAFQLKVDSALLIRSPGEKWSDNDKMPDVRHLQEQGQRMVTGTSVAGVLRSECRRILNTLRPTVDNEKLLAELWGAGPEDGAVKDPEGSRVCVQETFIKDSTTLRQTRVQIDRFTGATVDGAMLEEEVEVGGCVALNLTLDVGAESDKDWMVGLLLLAARELCSGWLTVGGGAAVGRGVLKGTASIKLSKKSTMREDITAQMEAEGCSLEDAQALQPYLDALRLALPGSNRQGDSNETDR